MACSPRVANEVPSESTGASSDEQLRHQIRRNNPASVAAVFRTRAKTAAHAISGTTLAPMRIGPKEYRSATMPVSSVAAIVPTPAPAPLKPLTVATVSGAYTSAGRFSTMVDNAAYESVEIAKQAVSQ